MAYADRLSAPLPGRLPSEFIRPPVVPKTTVTASQHPVSRVDGGPASARRVPAEVRLPCMLYAAVCPMPSDAPADLALVLAETRRAPGVVHVISYPGLVDPQSGIARPELAVVARGYWLARQALARLTDRLGMTPELHAQGRSPGDYACASRVTRGTAHFVEGRLRLWLATSDLAASRALAARMAGIAEAYVDLRVVGEADGGAPADVISAALALARELQPTPVQVIMAPVVTVPLASGTCSPVPSDGAQAPDALEDISRAVSAEVLAA